MPNDSKNARRPLLAEVAELAGVSISTVSKVANGGADVSAQTRTRVAQILKDHRFVAKKRRRNPGLTILILARAMQSPYTLDVIRGVAAEGARADMRVNVAVYPDSATDLSWVDDFRAANVAGVIAIASVLNEATRDRFDHAGIALVVIDPLNRLTRGAHSIGSTNWAGGLAATEHLISLGHSRIAMLSGEHNSMASRARVSGYNAAMDSAGLVRRDELVVPGSFSYGSGLESGLTVLAGRLRPTAIFTASDFQALGAIEAARRLKLRVPEDVSVVGFDDLIVAQLSSPPLTTVRQPIDQMGAAAVTMLADLIAGHTPQSHHTELATSLVVRGSTTVPAPG